MNDIKKVAIICSKGSFEDVYPALMLANGARMEGIDADVFFTFHGLDVVRKNRTEEIKSYNPNNPGLKLADSRHMEELDLPLLPELFQMTNDAGTKYYACKAACDMYGIKKADMCDEVQDIITIGDFYKLAAGAKIIFV